MSEPQFVLSPEAVDDLDQIWVYIARDNLVAADQVEAELRKAIRSVAEHPSLGHRRQDLTDLPVRFWPVYSYLIVYDAAERPVRIVRVLHGARDIGGLLG